MSHSEPKLQRVVDPVSKYAQAAAAAHDGDAALVEMGWNAFQNDFMQLLERCAGTWVAYLGKKQLGLAQTKKELLEKCLRDGLREEQLVICQVLPLEGEELLV